MVNETSHKYNQEGRSQLRERSKPAPHLENMSEKCDMHRGGKACALGMPADWDPKELKMLLSARITYRTSQREGVVQNQRRHRGGKKRELNS